MEPQKPISVLWERLREADPAEVAPRAAVAYDAEERAYRVPLVGVEHRVLPHIQRVEGPDGDAPFDATLICVQYLLTARNEPLGGERVNPKSLPYGDFFFRGQHELPTGGVERAFGEDADAFRAAAEAVGGKPLDIADAAGEFPALPRVPITLTLWVGDDEFPARAQFLLDKHADHQLPVDALWLLCGLLARRLVAAAET